MVDLPSKISSAGTAANIAARYQGPDGARRVCELLLRQPLLQGKQDIAEKLAYQATIEAYESGDVIIEQGGTDTDIFFILSGSVVVKPNNREDAVRAAGTHVGEMAMIDPAARRSATVCAREPSVLARLSEPAFSRIAIAHPSIWRFLARELADRLRQRVAKVPGRGPIPRVFIGSSSESLKLAESLQSALSSDALQAKLWTQDIFTATLTNIEALEAELVRADFAVLLLSADDQILSRGDTLQGPRDNLIAELGLFTGAIGRRRTIMLCPSEVSLKIPTDFLGVNPIKYSAAAGMGPVATQLRAIFVSLGPR